MVLKGWVSFILVGLAKFALRAGLLAVCIPMSSAAIEVMAPSTAISSFQQDPKPSRAPASLSSKTRQAKKPSEMTTADAVKKSILPNDFSSLVSNKPGTSTPLAPAVPVQATPPAPAAPPVQVTAPPVTAAPIFPSVPAPQKPVVSAPVAPVVTAPVAPAAPPNNSIRPTQEMPEAQSLETTGPTNYGGTSNISNRPTYTSNSNAKINKTQAMPPVQPDSDEWNKENNYYDMKGKRMTGTSPADFVQAKTEAGTTCLTGDCGKLEKIPLPKARHMAASSRPAPSSVTCEKYNCSCGQRELIAAAKRLAPGRNRSLGYCGPYVQKFITAVERKFPGFDEDPFPTNGRYPMPTQYGPGFIGNLRKRNWTELKLFSENQAPPGTVVIFRGPNNSMGYVREKHGRNHPGNYVGHVAIRGDDGLWYTDGRTVNGAVVGRSLEAAFIPGPSQNAACGDKTQ